MRKLFLSILMLGVVLSASPLAAQSTPIKDIQFTEDASGDSPLKGQVVTITGIITGETYAFGGSYYVQDANEPWSGVMVYDKNHEAAQGDQVTLTGTVDEYNGLTEIKNVTDFTIDSTGVGGIEPILVTTGEIGTGGAMAEAYEGCLVKVENLDISNPDVGYGEWEVNDGSGACVIDDKGDYYFNPNNYTQVQSITGLLDYSYSATKIRPRLAYDIVEAGIYTRLQRIQQVRQSDLLKAPEDYISDTSYMDGDTVTVKGIVTMPTGLSYAGDGIKFIFSEPEGGPWSAILSYHPDSTAYPSLFEGDEIEMTGYLGEYTTSQSNMTEFWITSPIDVLNIDQPLPEPDSVATGDLRLPVTAEQWGNVMVKVGNATVTDIDKPFMLFGVDDGSGTVYVDDDSDSLDNYEIPPLGTVAESIRGWVYHHYGTYTDSSDYQLVPLYKSDIVWGAGPPAVKNTQRVIATPTSADPVIINTKVETNLTLTSVSIYYKVDDGDYNQVVMTDMGDGNYSGEIPALTDGSFVSYYIEAIDEQAQSTTDPADLSSSNYCYSIKDGDLAIMDIQYTPWERGDSPYHGYPVQVTGIVTVDTSFYNKYEAYVIQDADGAWNGVYVTGVLPALSRGEEVTVYGVVDEYWADWNFKWDNNTLIIADSIKVNSSGNDVPSPTVVTTAELATNTAASEMYEGTLVRVEDFTFTKINDYDISIDDGTGECLLDADAWVADDDEPNPYFYFDGDNSILVIAGDTLQVGDQISFVQGVHTFSFGTHKIELRDLSDIGVATGVKNAVSAQPLSFALEQNYPNPFNPETRIYFELPNTQNVKLTVYNMNGQKVKTIVDERYNAGYHVVNWDGRDGYGQRVSTGIYFYRIQAGEFIATKKMSLIK